MTILTGLKNLRRFSISPFVCQTDSSAAEAGWERRGIHSITDQCPY